MIKLQAREHPLFRKGCVSLAQNLHQVDVKLKIKLLGQKNLKVRPLNENKAIENGASFISESFIFTVAGSLILYESYRQRRKELNRREAVLDDISMLQDEIEYLKKNLSQYVKIEDYKPAREFHPTVLKVEPVSESEHKSNLINMILTKLDDEEIKLFNEKDTLQVKDKKLFTDDTEKVLYLKLEKTSS